ncbi:RNA 2',3'-cyclic phosphodiesterase [Streptomyces kaniharaensis]|uniref:RNA 2',3'-cyclic phosphodiesterase n=1 Tax=Streptomyces kaniharaensis TaxID=212423 RepID=A0A6N7KPY8_9ACTN|nr:RNA 2',3'-cyclic phosphodiesterase [Streptomyces kaniharaensis]MQS12795.1 RNA 2',3'-cyclic phosphodiesterase [Streptomyces kaniharaensis]
MRLFVAVLPPVEALQGLSDAVAPVRGLPGADRLRWTTVEGWHLTLAFLGQVPEDRLPELEAGLADVADVHPAHRLRIAGAGRFGDRVLWAGVEGQTWALRRLAEAVYEATADVAGEADPFRFHPHLTLARAGSSRGHRRAVQRVAAGELEGLALALAEYRGQEWEAAELHLMKSELDGGFTHYETVRAWPLARWASYP